MTLGVHLSWICYDGRAMKRWSALPCLLCAGLWLASAAGANAQVSSPGDAAAARELRGHGIEASSDGRWGEALENFEQSYELSNDPATLVQIAEAQAATGRLMAAAASYERFLESARRRDGRQAREAREALAEVQARVPRVVIRVTGLRGGDEVWLDDGLVEHDELETPRPIDPGEHTLIIARGGTATVERTFDVAEGADSEVLVDTNAPTSPRGDPRFAPDPPDGEGTAGDTEGGGVLASPWFWIGVGVVVAAGVAIPVAIAASDSPPAETYTGTLGAGVLTFR